jgi:hypothetical protein
MLYFYQSISPHPIENLHRYLDYFFTRLFAELHPTYDHAHYIQSDFHTILTTPRLQLNNKLSDVFNAYMGLQPHEKARVQVAYNNNNNIEGVCNMAVRPIKYGELPAGVRTQIKTLYDYLWEGGLEVDAVVSQCGTVKQHFNEFRKTNVYSVCPFCGMESLLCEHDDGRDDYDHFLPKAQYPFISINFLNLFPICHRCNSKSKGTNDTPFVPATTTQRLLYYPYDTTIPNHSLILIINSSNTDLSDPATWTLEVDCTPTANRAKKESWMQIFNIETRYKAKIAKDSYKWKERIRSKYRLQRNRSDFVFSNFRIDILNDFEDYKNYDNGILMKYFDAFIVNDPHLEANLTGVGVI